MKKIVLTKLENEEAEKIKTLDANAYTFKTLLNNQFIEESDQNDINNLLKDLFYKKEQLYEEFVNKYNLPYIADNKYFISPITHELYIEIYE